MPVPVPVPVPTIICTVLYRVSTCKCRGTDYNVQECGSWVRIPSRCLALGVGRCSKKLSRASCLYWRHEVQATFLSGALPFRKARMTCFCSLAACLIMLLKGQSSSSACATCGRAVALEVRTAEPGGANPRILQQELCCTSSRPARYTRIVVGVS
ncbi:hypothetical protein F5882DRAFT_390702 [Hyaloscypha sp. PMI_1271]|nr:hypothetical protein F5882DRAFT_390702 [Hyaloscypha sp. PMI_1271]